MSGMNRCNAQEAAVEIVKAGLMNGTIKLHGSTGRAPENVVSDVAYLTALIEGIVKAFNTEP